MRQLLALGVLYTSSTCAMGQTVIGLICYFPDASAAGVRTWPATTETFYVDQSKSWTVTDEFYKAKSKTDEGEVSISIDRMTGIATLSIKKKYESWNSRASEPCKRVDPAVKKF